MEAYFEGKEMILVCSIRELISTKVWSVIRDSLWKTTYLEQSKVLGMSKQLGLWLPPMEKILIVVPCHRVIGTDGSPPVMQEVYGVKNGFWNMKINKSTKFILKLFTHDFQIVWINILFLDIETVPEAADYNELDSEMKIFGSIKPNTNEKTNIPRKIFDRAGIWAEFGK
jgi:hypothetical protein